MLAGCSGEQTKTVYAAPPEVLALFAGQARGSDFSLARGCGADGSRITIMAANEQAPASLSADAAAIYKAALVSSAGNSTEKPAINLCAAIRKRSEFASTFPSGPPPSKSEQKAAADRKARATPSYCADGSDAVLRDPTVTAGLQAIREKCNAGDTVALPSNATGIIASACDLSKPVPVAGPNVFCTLGRIRSIRTGR